MTTIYLIRHSIRFDKEKIQIRKTNDTLQQIAEKDILSIEGEERAKYLASLEELDNIDVLFTSNCPRTLQTAKYLMDKQNLKVIIDERLNERRIGIPNDNAYPNWFELQYLDENYKTVEGESQLDVRCRMEEFMKEVLANYKDKRIAVFTHGYVITFYLMKFLKFISVDSKQRITFEYQGKIFFDRKLDAPEIFKLEFDSNNQLYHIENIVINYCDFSVKTSL